MQINSAHFVFSGIVQVTRQVQDGRVLNMRRLGPGDSFGDISLVVGIDKRGHPTGPIIAWLDQRTVSEAEWLRSRISEEKMFAITGSPIDATFSLCKLLWLRRQRPEQFNAAVHWLLVAD